MEHKIAVVVWNEFIAQTINKGCNFSFDNLEKRIKETINQALSQHDVIKNEVAVCEHKWVNLTCEDGWSIEGQLCTKCGKQTVL